MNYLTWAQLRDLAVGTLLVFPQRYDIYPHTIVPGGTLAITAGVGGNGTIIDVLPADTVVCAALREWNGCVSFSPFNDGYGWDEESPVALKI